MGKKIGFGFLAVCMCFMAIVLLIIPFQSTGDDGVTLLSGVLMAVVYGAAAIFSILIVLGMYDPSNIRWGWGFAAFICGNLAAVGIGSISAPGGSQNLIVGIVCAALTFFCIKKSGGIGRILPESRAYTLGDPLPISACPGLLLARGEIGHLCESVKIGKVKNVVTGHISTRSGGSVRVARGLSVHSGSSRSTTTRADVLDAGTGTLYVTNRRIIGTSPKYSFDEKLSAITTIKLYADGFLLQIGSKNYMILIRDSKYVSTILNVLRYADVAAKK